MSQPETLLAYCKRELERLAEQLRVIRLRLDTYEWEARKKLPHTWPPATGASMNYPPGKW